MVGRCRSLCARRDRQSSASRGGRKPRPWLLARHACVCVRVRVRVCPQGARGPPADHDGHVAEAALHRARGGVVEQRLRASTDKHTHRLDSLPRAVCRACAGGWLAMRRPPHCAAACCAAGGERSPCGAGGRSRRVGRRPCEGCRSVPGPNQVLCLGRVARVSPGPCELSGGSLAAWQCAGPPDRVV